MAEKDVKGARTAIRASRSYCVAPEVFDSFFRGVIVSLTLNTSHTAQFEDQDARTPVDDYAWAPQPRRAAQPGRRRVSHGLSRRLGDDNCASGTIPTHR